MSRQAARFQALCSGAAVTMLGGCITVGPDYQPAPVDGRQDAFLADDALLAPGGVPRSDWWTAFSDPRLAALVADAAGNNLDLAEAEARIRAAATQLRAARTQALPTGGASASYTRQLAATATFGSFGGGAGGAFADAAPIDLYSVGVDASWEADLFGRIRRNVESARASLGGMEAMRADIARLVAAETASAYLTLRELDARLLVARSNLDGQTRILELTRQLFQSGAAAELDVLRQSNLVDATRAGVETLRESRAETLSALALLTGRTTPQLVAAHPDLETPSGDSPPVTAEGPIEIGDPEGLLRRRPDVRAAERNVAARTAAIGVATADLYPSLTLAGNVSWSALTPGDLTDPSALGYGFGPQLRWGVFNIPAILANIATAEAETDLALIQFEQTVLTALTETDAALSAYGRAVEQARIRAGALDNSRRALSLVEARYEAGADSLLALLDAQRDALDAEDAEAAARYNALRRRVDVHRALGG